MELVVKVRKSELLARVQANREEHRKIFLDALEGFQEMVTDELESRLAQVKRGKIPLMHIGLPVPEDHTRDYDAVLDMLEMHTDEFLEIDSADFANFVRDDWQWKRQFLASASNYSTLAR